MSLATAFLAYRSADEPVVEEVANALCRRGILPWFAADDRASLDQIMRTHVGVVGFLAESALASGELQSQLQTLLQVDSLDIPSFKEILSTLTVDQMADTLSQRLYQLLNFKEAQAVNIVIDQRGHGSRKEAYLLPRDVPNLKQKLTAIASLPTLVFRPDTGERSERETIIGSAFDMFRQHICDTLEQLEFLKTVQQVNILGDGQLGIVCFLGQYFNRTNGIPLECFNIRHKSVFSNEEQEWHCPPTGGNPHCETVADAQNQETGYHQRLRRQLKEKEEQWSMVADKLSRIERQRIVEHDESAIFKVDHDIKQVKIMQAQLEQEIKDLEAEFTKSSLPEEDPEIQALLPDKIKSGEKHSVLAMYVGTRNQLYLKQWKKHVIEEHSSGQRIFVETGQFTTSSQVVELIRDVVALLQRLSAENETETIKFYTTLPFNIVPLLAANLTEHVIPGIEFMERDFGQPNRTPQALYVHLSMK